MIHLSYYQINLLTISSKIQLKCRIVLKKRQIKLSSLVPSLVKGSNNINNSILPKKNNLKWRYLLTSPSTLKNIDQLSRDVMKRRDFRKFWSKEKQSGLTRQILYPRMIHPSFRIRDFRANKRILFVLYI